MRVLLVTASLPSLRLFLAGLLVLGAIGSTSGQTEKSPAASIVRVGHPTRLGMLAGVRVADLPLLFTGQLLADDVQGDARTQTMRALDRLEAVLARGGSDLARVLRLNVYVAADADAAAAEAAIAARFAGAPPTIVRVRSPLTVPQARVALDAVAASARETDSVAIGSDAAVMPAGAKVFLSGVAVNGPDLTTSVRTSMASLYRIAGHLGLASTDVVQLKVFLRPFADHAVVAQEIAASFGGAPVPPIVYVEWVAGSFVEIEMVLSGRALKVRPAEPLTFPSIPGVVASPRYSSAAVVAAGTPLIFLGEIDGGADGAVREQWKRIFAELGGTLFELGSSYRNLVKAIYYVADPAGRGTLNEIRAVYYDPARPPAASAIQVRGLGRPGGFSVDLIAVPQPGPR